MVCSVAALLILRANQLTSIILGPVWHSFISEVHAGFVVYWIKWSGLITCFSSKVITKLFNQIRSVCPQLQPQEFLEIGCSFKKILELSCANRHLLCLWSLMLYLPLICLILLQWKHASSSVNSRRGKKNLVLSSWGDESTLSEGYINPHYISDYYKSYNERTNQNLVSSIAWSICMASFFSNNVFVLTESSFINTQTLEWRCDLFRSIGRLDMLYWWELSSWCYSCFSSCKFMMTPHQLLLCLLIYILVLFFHWCCYRELQRLTCWLIDYLLQLDLEGHHLIGSFLYIHYLDPLIKGKCSSLHQITSARWLCPLLSSQADTYCILLRVVL